MYQNISKIIKEVYCRFIDDEVTSLGAQLTYYIILSFFPFLIFLITLIGFTPLISKNTLQGFLGILPYSISKFIHDIINQIIIPDKGLLLLSGIGASLWAASNGVSALIKGINKAYDQKETRPFWKVKLISVVSTIALAFIILFSLILLVFGEISGKYMFDFLGIPKLFKIIWNILRYIIPLISLLSVFISIYYFIPNRRLSFKEVLPGSIFSTLGWLIISTAFSFYINNFRHYSLTFGSIGAIIILLLWLYWSNIIILLGGELNAALAFNRDGIIKPESKGK